MDSGQSLKTQPTACLPVSRAAGVRPAAELVPAAAARPAGGAHAARALRVGAEVAQEPEAEEADVEPPVAGDPVRDRVPTASRSSDPKLMRR